MAKVSSADAGSSCHIHLSLFDTRTKQNPFRGDANSPTDTLVGQQPSSECFRHFLAGWMAKMPELMPLYAPTVNSYKRFSAGTFAPTSLTWSTDNRSAGFRIVGSGDAFRIECRIPGADCNPYMALSASIASGLWGIDNRVEPEPEYIGNAYDDPTVRRGVCVVWCVCVCVCVFVRVALFVCVFSFCVWSNVLIFFFFFVFVCFDVHSLFPLSFVTISVCIKHAHVHHTARIPVILVPCSLHEATECFAESEFAVEAFGEEMVEHYLHHFRLEQKVFNVGCTC
jgi:glutamine synthetase